MYLIVSLVLVFVVVVFYLILLERRRRKRRAIWMRAVEAAKGVDGQWTDWPCRDGCRCGSYEQHIHKVVVYLRSLEGRKARPITPP